MGVLVAGLALGGGVFLAAGGRAAETEAVDWDSASARIRIDVSERKLYFEENGEVQRTWSVAVGTAKHPTPKGTFAVRRVIWNPRWVPPDAAWAKDKKPTPPGHPDNPMGRVKAFFKDPDYYIHGTNAESTIGSAASHGCVRMRNEDIIELSRLLVEHGGAPIEPGLIQRLVNRVRQTHEARLSKPVPLRVVA